MIIFVRYIYKNWVKLILFEIVLKNRSQSFATFRYQLTHYALECTCKYMVGPSHKVSSRDMRQMSFRTWTLQLIKCLNGVGKFHLLWNASHVLFHNEYFLIQYQISNNILMFGKIEEKNVLRNYKVCKYYAFDIEFRSSRYQVH